jgi:hypothetical protein
MFKPASECGYFTDPIGYGWSDKEIIICIIVIAIITIVGILHECRKN